MLSSPGVQSQLRKETKAHHDAKIKHRGITTKFSKKEAQRLDNTWAIALKQSPISTRSPAQEDYAADSSLPC